MAPLHCESGTFRGQRRTIGGRKPLRDAAYMAALIARQHNPVIKTFRQRRRNRPTAQGHPYRHHAQTHLRSQRHDKHDEPWAA
ncbi:transposase [Novosphingobium subterraneum]|uniref:transposase n=1 Tax=Novosphingobium subterraneum TaxID=48936 RepID=UPI00146FF097